MLMFSLCHKLISNSPIDGNNSTGNFLLAFKSSISPIYFTNTEKINKKQLILLLYHVFTVYTALILVPGIKLLIAM